jgi:hypothetical protein
MQGTYPEYGHLKEIEFFRLTYAVGHITSATEVDMAKGC